MDKGYITREWFVVVQARGRLEQVDRNLIEAPYPKENGYESPLEFILFVNSSLVQLKDRIFEWVVCGYEKIAELFARILIIYKTLVPRDYMKEMRDKQYEEGLDALRRDIHAFLEERM